MIEVERGERVWVVTIDRPERRNAVDRPTAEAMSRAFDEFEASPACVAVLTGKGGTFCAGADLKAVAEGNPNRLEPDGEGPMGPTRKQLSKPVIAAVEGHAVAGGLELALWCDLRVAARGSVFGVFCRRFGVPLIDGGTIRLPRLIGQSRALDMILTGRAVPAEEALSFGLVNRLVEDGQALAAARELAEELAALPQACMRADRHSLHTQWDLPMKEALTREFLGGLPALEAEGVAGSRRFQAGQGRHGERA